MRKYVIHLEGFQSHECVARSAGAAKYADWKAAREAGYFAGADGFKRYLERVHVLHLGPADTKMDAPTQASEDGSRAQPDQNSKEM